MTSSCVDSCHIRFQNVHLSSLALEQSWHTYIISLLNGYYNVTMYAFKYMARILQTCTSKYHSQLIIIPQQCIYFFSNMSYKYRSVSFKLLWKYDWTDLHQTKSCIEFHLKYIADQLYIIQLNMYVYFMFCHDNSPCLVISQHGNIVLVQATDPCKNRK